MSRRRIVGSVVSLAVAALTLPATAGDYPDSLKWWRGQIGPVDGDDVKNTLFFVALAAFLGFAFGPPVWKRWKLWLEDKRPVRRSVLKAEQAAHRETRRTHTGAVEEARRAVHAEAARTEEKLRRRLAEAEDRASKPEQIQAYWLELGNHFAEIDRLHGRWRKSLAHMHDSGKNPNIRRFLEQVEGTFTPLQRTVDEHRDMGAPAGDPFQHPFELGYNPPTAEEVLAWIERSRNELVRLRSYLRESWWPS
jgi:hypothetical protein